MKTVFNSTSEVCHVFAQRIQTEGRAGNVFFRNDKIYSYGYHYELARFFENKNGETAILINNEGYSSSTGKHISIIISATSQYRQFFRLDTDKEKALFRLNELFDKLAVARKPEIYVLEANRLFFNYSDYCNFLGTKIDKDIKKLYSLFDSEKISENIEKRKAQIIKERKAKEKRERQRIQSDLKDFFGYRKDHISTNEDYCRLSKDGLKVETSKGVKVDAKDAKKLYQLIKAGKDIKGYKIDYYTVISLNGTLKIGCHNINVKNMHEVGEKLLQM